MDFHEERDRFLEEQAQRFKEPILTFALVRVLEGPPLGGELAFLLVSASALHILPTTHEPAVFGIPFSKKASPSPVPLSVNREELGSIKLVRPQGWWQALTQPRGMLRVAEWKVQTVGDAEAFVSAWNQAWSKTSTL